MLLERRKVSVAGQPRGMFLPESREISVRQGAFGITTPRRVGVEQQRQLALVERAEVDPVRTEVTQGRNGAIGQQTGPDQGRRVDQVGVARKRRKTLVGRIAKAG